MTEERRLRAVLADKVAVAILNALGVPIGKTQRIILDLNVGEPARVYVQFIGDERMLDMDLPEIRAEDVIMKRLVP